MESIIRLLPDAIANQIAAGEVVQRPASVVKELLENAIDAGATKIDLLIKDAGKTLIQITDDGSGMSAQDARMAFERHATSKIRKQDDLFNILTLGFRGEAMASIAAVAQVKLRTRLADTELGTELDIAANEVQQVEPVVTPKGTSIQVKNLFYNVPARRNFLKSNGVETRHIMNELLRVAIPHPEIHFTFKHNDTLVYDLPKGKLKERLYALLGNDLKGELSSIEEETGYVKFTGVIGSPKAARKTREEQFFFVNHRFIKNGLLHHAVSKAYEALIPKEKQPFYCIFIDIDPIHVDINIHPTKTEVKFDDEQTLYALLQGAVKRNLGSLHSIPQMDFADNVNDTFQKQIYNSRPAFHKEETIASHFSGFSNKTLEKKDNVVPKPEDWNQLYQPFEKKNPFLAPNTLPVQENERLDVLPEKSAITFAVMYGTDYILAEKDKNLYIIHRKNAEERVLYERWLKMRNEENVPVQQLLFPQTFEFSPTDKWTLLEAEEDLLKLGLEVKDFQGNTVIVYGTPPDMPAGKTKELLTQVIADIHEIGKTQLHTQLPEKFARTIATKIATFKTFNPQEAKLLAENLFKTTNPAHSPTGKQTYKLITGESLGEMFG